MTSYSLAVLARPEHHLYVERRDLHIRGDCSCGAWLDYVVDEDGQFHGSVALNEGLAGRCVAVACAVNWLDRKVGVR